MNKSEFFTKDGWLKDEHLWQLREQISLGSIYTSAYDNHFGIDPQNVQDFFLGFLESHCTELAIKDNLCEKAKTLYAERMTESPTDVDFESFYLSLQQEWYDNEKTLLDWYHSFEGHNPLPPKMVNVDIRWTFNRSIQVIASCKEEAEEIVNQMLLDKEIPASSFGPDDYDWELDTTYQPE